MQLHKYRVPAMGKALSEVLQGNQGERKVRFLPSGSLYHTYSGLIYVSYRSLIQCDLFMTEQVVYYSGCNSLY